jgi:alkylation response protein AidB-like acyl-CoA dehydrogenase
MSIEPFLDDDERTFETEVREFLHATAAQRGPLQYFQDRGGDTRALYRELGDRGWLGLAWPQSVGGGGLSETYEFVLWNELAYQRAARPDIAAGIIAKSLISFGTAEQCDRFLPAIQRGEIGFSLGYSEPEAGSDLGSLRSRARRDGDQYIVDGEKRWSSDAHTADYLWLLCRTGEQSSGSRGLTVLIVALDSPGVTVSPIPTIDGHLVNEVHLREVRVPASNRVGEEGQGWMVVTGALARERHLQVMPGRLRRDLEDLEAWIVDQGLHEDSGVARELTDIRAEVAAAEMRTLAVLQAVVGNGDSLIVAAHAKLVGSLVIQRMARLPVELGDVSALVCGDAMEFLWRECVMETIAGGTTEIMRDIIARRELLVYG